VSVANGDPDSCRDYTNSAVEGRNLDFLSGLYQ